MTNYEPCSICEDYIEDVICDKDKCPVKKMKSEIEDLFYKLSGVMHYVDKWLDGDELKQDEVNRAMTMREKTLQMVENLEIELKAMRGAANSYKAEVERLNFLLKDNWARIEELDKLNEKVKSETTKEVLTKLKEKYANYEPYETLYAHYIWNDIDKLLEV